MADGPPLTPASVNSWRERWIWLLVALALLVLAVAMAGPLRRALEAVDFAADIAVGTAPSALKQRTPLPIRTLTTYTVGGNHYLGDIYRPGGDRGAQAAAIAVPGAVVQGKDDPRLVAFATSLARAGFLVLVPDVPGTRSLEISAADTEVIADAVRHLAGFAGLDAKRAIGLFAFSYAAGPTLIAAMEPDTRGLARFVCTAGAYYSVEAAVTYFTTGYYRRQPGTWIPGHPSAYAKWAFLSTNVARLQNIEDRDALKAIAARRLTDEDADVSNLAQKLGPEGRVVYALITNRDPDLVPSLMAALPTSIRQAMHALDLSHRDFKSLEAQLILIHGRDDTLIPYTESVALARAASGRADLYLIGSLGHVEPRLTALPDVYKFWRAGYEILAERDAMPPPKLPVGR